MSPCRDRATWAPAADKRRGSALKFILSGTAASGRADFPSDLERADKKKRRFPAFLIAHEIVIVTVSLRLALPDHDGNRRHLLADPFILSDHEVHNSTLFSAVWLLVDLVRPFPNLGRPFPPLLPIGPRPDVLPFLRLVGGENENRG